VGLRMCTCVNVSAYVGEVYMFGKVEKHGMCVSAYGEREGLRGVCVLYVTDVCYVYGVSGQACVMLCACMDGCADCDNWRCVSACV